MQPTCSTSLQKSFIKKVLFVFFQVKTDNYSSCPPQVFPNGVVVGTTAAKTTGLLSVFLSELSSYQQHRTHYIAVVSPSSISATRDRNCKEPTLW